MLVRSLICPIFPVFTPKSQYKLCHKRYISKRLVFGPIALLIRVRAILPPGWLAEKMVLA